METRYIEQSFAVDPDAPPARETRLHAAPVEIVDALGKGFIASGGADLVGGLPVTALCADRRVQIVEDGRRRWVAGVAVHRAGGDAIFVPTDPVAPMAEAQFLGAAQAPMPSDVPETACGLPSFVRGTRIQTFWGARAVEDLRAGDRITTRDGGPQTLRWIGRQTVAAGGDLAPVAIGAGVLGNPRRLCVAPRQRLIVRDWRAELFFGQDEALVEAHELIDGVAVRPDPADSIAYYHLLFDRPEVIFAEGVAVASLDPADHRPGRLDEARRPSKAAPAAILLRAA